MRRGEKKQEREGEGEEEVRDKGGAPATRASHSAPPVARRAALRVRLHSLLSWNTRLARTSASVNTCHHSRMLRTAYIFGRLGLYLGFRVYIQDFRAAEDNNTDNGDKYTPEGQ